MNIVDQQTFRDAMSCMGAAVNIITTFWLSAMRSVRWWECSWRWIIPRR